MNQPRPCRRPRSLALTPALLACLAPVARPGVPEEKAAPGAAGIGDTYYATLGAGGYDARHYALELDVDMEAEHVRAKTTLRAVAEHSLASFHLDLVGLEVSGVRVDDAPAEFRREGRELIVTPATPVPAGAEFTVEVAYHGRPDVAPDPSHPQRPGVGWRFMESGSYVLSECVGAASWFPCNDHPLDKATFSFQVTVDEPWVVAANGILEEELDLGERRRFLWRSKYPMAPYLATVNIARFEVRVEEGPGGMPLRTYYPKDMTPFELKQFERQGEMVEFFELCFGPYPFESVGAIIADEMLGGALETQTMPVYGRGLPEAVVAHEIAHQWFGDSVSVENWEDMWLNEGFATYGSWLWEEYARGMEAYERMARMAYRMCRGSEVGPPADPGLAELFGPRTYVRGAWTLHCLRLEVEDELFFEILQEWTERYRHGNASTADFIALAEEVSGRELDELFDALLFAPVVPEDPLFEN